MNAFPMIKVKWSNELIMAAVFLVLILYHLPIWNRNPSEIISFVLLVVFGLLIDCVAGILRNKRLWCCVSGAVTAAMISLLTGGVPFWGRMLGVAAALILGKHIWGGTGKNILNPAMVGVLVVMTFFSIPYPSFEASMLLLPAVIFSLAFLLIRPFAGIGFMLGMTASLVFNLDLSMGSILSYGVIFWGCLVMTDPVTITPNPAGGLASGFLAGFAALYYFPMPVAIIAGILAVNLFSDTVNGIINKNLQMKAKVKIPKVFHHSSSQTQAVDLTQDKPVDKAPVDLEQFAKEEILKRIRDNNVFGMGGGAFPAYEKIMAVMEAKVNDKYLIINGAECDPGLIHDEWILQHHMEEIAQGVKLLKVCIPFRSIHLAVKNKHGLKATDPMEMQQIPDIYPIGAEKILIHKILNKNIASDQLPASYGILVLNVQTVYAIGQAVIRNKPVEARYLTVADLKIKTAKVVRARLGMKLSEVMEAVYPGAVNIYAGGGIMQSHLTEEDAEVDRTVNFICTGTFPSYKESPQCSKCGMCSRNCPSGLKVNVIADLVEQGKLEETVKYRAADCISCGSCSYSCLAGRNLAAKVNRAKEAVK